MTGKDLRQARLMKRWTQESAARQMGVSQGYLSLLEKGRRSVPNELAQKFLKKYTMSAASLPLHVPNSRNLRANVDSLARCLGSLGYPGFSYFKVQPNRNPADFLLTTLMQSDVDSRVAKALPWLVVKYTDMNWDWLVDNAKRYDLQNRLGFTVTLARQVLERTNNTDKASALVSLEQLLDHSRLVREDTFCHDSLTRAEKNWLRERRSPEAQHWNLLTDLTAEQLTYAA